MDGRVPVDNDVMVAVLVGLVHVLRRRDGNRPDRGGEHDGQQPGQAHVGMLIDSRPDLQLNKA
jgi:hypothetical protein